MIEKNRNTIESLAILAIVGIISWSGNEILKIRGVENSVRLNRTSIEQIKNENSFTEIQKINVRLTSFEKNFSKIEKDLEFLKNRR